MRNLAMVWTVVATAACASVDGSDRALREEFAPLAFLSGWCWAGEFPGGKRTDVHCFEPVFGGQHLRDRHALSGGAQLYRGETLYSWDGEAQTLAYVYWNSLGGVSRGTATPDGDRIAFPDEAYTSPEGERVVVSTYWTDIRPDRYDSLTVERYANGATRERRVTYRRAGFVADPADLLQSQNAAEADGG